MALYCNWPAAIVLSCGVNYLGQASAFRLNPNLYLEVLGDRFPRNRLANTKKVPVPTSGCVQREMTQGPTLRFSMMGNGGPLWALAGTDNIRQSTQKPRPKTFPRNRVSTSS